ncbi:MAG: glycosyltransferase [Rhodocyclaceae bacterium]|nr:glycosyltransferase [Rhodocyclaceae bacterium]MDZ4214765.1 glycosyltransferase [Rhodocyclaceae bacterium]
MILMYHKISPNAPTMWWVDVDSFYRQLHSLRNRKVVYLDDYDSADATQVVITFDGVYRNVLQYAAPLLKHFGYPFELFVTSDYIGKDNEFDTPEPFTEFASQSELKQLINMGGRLQWHSRSHANLGKTNDRELIRRELDIPCNVRQLDSSGFKWFAYPHGTFNDLVLDCLRTSHFIGGLSCHQGSDNNRLCLNRMTVTTDTCLSTTSVSVVIACYNYGIYLIEAVESVLRQTVAPQEILISDDASTDDTPIIMEMLAKRYVKLIRTHRNERNLGIIEHFNKALSMTSGDYICFLGADNRFRSDYLERTVELLDAQPEAAIAYTDFALFGERAALIAADFSEHYPVTTKGGRFHIVKFPEFDDESRRTLLKKRNFIHGSSLFRRRAFFEAGGYASSTGPEDWFLFRRMIESGWSAVRSPYPLLEYRQHSRDQANVRLVSELALSYYKDECKRLGNEISRIKKTVSWRVTAPLRASWNISRDTLKVGGRALRSLFRFKQ